MRPKGAIYGKDVRVGRTILTYIFFITFIHGGTIHDVQQ